MLFDMQKDPMQMKNVINDPAYKTTAEQLKKRYQELRKTYKVPENCPGGKGTPIPNLTPPGNRAACQSSLSKRRNFPALFSAKNVMSIGLLSFFPA